MQCSWQSYTVPVLAQYLQFRAMVDAVFVALGTIPAALVLVRDVLGMLGLSGYVPGSDGAI
jgi:hypothetical protein